MSLAIEEISLHIDGQVFRVKKDVLCEYSDYFRAMFSGNYVEQKQQDITIDVVDANSMDIILRYMNIGLIDLSEFPLSTIGNLAMAANFLQITELIKQIKYCLDLQLSLSNWVEIMVIAENASYTTLEHLSSCFGLLAFKDMKPEYIPNIQRLFWYLSNPYLDTNSELDVFKFGIKWIQHPQTHLCADLLLIILGCLDVTNLTIQDLKEMSLMMTDCENSLVVKVIECMKMVLDNKMELNSTSLNENKNSLCETFSESVYLELLNLVKESKQRKLSYTSVVPIWSYKDGKLEFAPHYVYMYRDCGNLQTFEKWLEVAEKNLWGWNLASWGATKLVLVCGEHGRGTGQYMRDVKIYDTLREEWYMHGAQLPTRRHAGVTVSGDSLFIVGGIGEFRVTQDTAFIYNLKERTHRKIARFPDAMQSPAVCTHFGSVYAAGHKHIYKYEDTDVTDKWIIVASTEMRVNRMISFQEYIYCSQNYFSNLYRFRPGIDKTLEMITHFSAPPAAFCNVGSHLMVFTRPVCGTSQELKVEKYTGPCACPDVTCHGYATCGPKTVWAQKSSPFTINDVAGSCSLVLSMPMDMKLPISLYHQKYLSRFSNVTYIK